MAERPENKDQMRAYREGVWARREGQQLGGGSGGGGGGGGKGGKGCALTVLAFAAGVAGVVARVKGWTA